MDYNLPGSSVRPWDSPGKNTGVGCHALLQGIFPTQGLNPGLPPCSQTLQPLSHQGSQTLSLISFETTYQVPTIIGVERGVRNYWVG